ncbi:hypothetical protein P5P86_11125 [Nocardioides sp. BP30]|uniref:hypothetical protein n=1 Tax=Nocardioides sp. BP30 TaxID=3036374 RepID=UPI00246979C6|nr:hypothetical protein [Nocardioides sp. BP30]WGL50515.1 hypothetical protein P5P86_11125 [Nocardioides sp. BP30]
MSEAEFDRADAAAPVRTGMASVDEVLAAVDALDETPVEQHAAIFGDAHDALRRALDADPEA